MARLSKYMCIFNVKNPAAFLHVARAVSLISWWILAVDAGGNHQFHPRNTASYLIKSYLQCRCNRRDVSTPGRRRKRGRREDRYRWKMKRRHTIFSLFTFDEHRYTGTHACDDNTATSERSTFPVTHPQTSRSVRIFLIFFVSTVHLYVTDIGLAIIGFAHDCRQIDFPGVCV